jgi:DNA polymerase I-like protein with 3'-5' exonuclease and polymerase domains
MWWEKIKTQLANNNRSLYNLFGHKRRFLDEWGQELFKAAVSYPPQSTSVWVLNYAMIDTYHDNEDYMNNLWLHAQVHDELLLSYPTDDWLKMARVILRVNQHMSPTLQSEGQSFVIGTDLAIGLNWGDESKANPRGIRKIKLYEDEKLLADALEAEYEKIK